MAAYCVFCTESLSYPQSTLLSQLNIHSVPKHHYFINVGVDGGWGRWSDWSVCSVTCGDGLRSRTRECDDPAPMHGGKDCSGGSFETEVCVTRRCSLGEYIHSYCLIIKSSLSDGCFKKRYNL